MSSREPTPTSSSSTRDPRAPHAPGPELDLTLGSLAASVVDEGVSPGAVIAAAVRVGHARSKGGTRDGSTADWITGIGWAGHLVPGGAEVLASTRYDLASVTKPYTALVAARLHRLAIEGECMGPRLDDPLGLWVSEARGTPSESVRLELFLAHRAGLDGHRPLYEPLTRGGALDRAAAVREAAMARREGCSGAPPFEGFPPEYSDLGYLLVAAALESASGDSLATLVADQVSAFVGGSVLSSADLDDAQRELVAPTEVVPWRGGEVRGEVHDENAWALGRRGVCGHAGLFGSASDVLALGVSLVDALSSRRLDWLTPADLEPLIRARPGGTLRAGFDGKSETGSSAGTMFGPRSFGHLGFTGTSLWIDPDASLVAVVLTNRVYPSRQHANLRATRPRLHDGIARWADEARRTR